MFSIVLYNILYYLIPPHRRKQIILELLKVYLKPVQVMYDNMFYEAKWNSQIASFETYLNEQYGLPYVFANRASLISSTSIIWIENTAAVRAIFLFNKIESRPPIILFNKYQPGFPYSIGQYASESGEVYRSKTNSNLGNQPSISPSNWEYVGIGPHLWSKDDPVNVYDFIVWVPNTLTYDVDILNSQIKKYKLLGKKYTINTY